MQLIVVLSLSIAALGFAGQIPESLQFPLPLVGAAVVTSAMMYVLAKA